MRRLADAGQVLAVQTCVGGAARAVSSAAALVQTCRLGAPGILSLLPAVRLLLGSGLAAVEPRLLVDDGAGSQLLATTCKLHTIVYQLKAAHALTSLCGQLGVPAQAAEAFAPGATLCWLRAAAHHVQMLAEKFPEADRTAGAPPK